ncbi:MAG: DUF6644 family protein [Bryobacteraceae bacterium]
MLLSFTIWFQNIPLFIWLRDQVYGYPIALAAHLVFISLFAAMIVMTDLRMLGVAFRGQSLSDIIDQLRVPKRIGFILAATCGVLVFGLKSEEYYYNFSFRIKVALFILVGLHALVFRGPIYNRAAELDNQPLSGKIKVAAVISMLLWTGIIIAGRGIGYIPAPLFSHHFE